MRGNRSYFRESKPYYCKAKWTEHVCKDKVCAQKYYIESVAHNEKASDSVNRVCLFLLNQGRTEESCEFLQQHRHAVASRTDYQQLYDVVNQLKRPTGRSFSKILKISPVSRETEKDVAALFRNPKGLRKTVVFKTCAVAKFLCHESACSSLKRFSGWGQYDVEWLSDHGSSVGRTGRPRAFSESYRLKLNYG